MDQNSLLKQFEYGVGLLTCPDFLKDYLNFISRLPSLDHINQMLLFLQSKGNISMVASLSAWRKNGYQVIDTSKQLYGLRALITSENQEIFKDLYTLKEADISYVPIVLYDIKNTDADEQDFKNDCIQLEENLSKNLALNGKTLQILEDTDCKEPYIDCNREEIVLNIRYGKPREREIILALLNLYYKIYITGIYSQSVSYIAKEILLYVSEERYNKGSHIMNETKLAAMLQTISFQEKIQVLEIVQHFFHILVGEFEGESLDFSQTLLLKQVVNGININEEVSHIMSFFFSLKDENYYYVLKIRSLVDIMERLSDMEMEKIITDLRNNVLFTFPPYKLNFKQE